MTRLEAVGRSSRPTVPDPEAEPIEVPIIGYRAARDERGKVVRNEEGEPIPEEVEFVALFQHMSQTGIVVRQSALIASIESLDGVEKAGQLGQAVLAFLMRVIRPESRDGFVDFVSSPEIEVEVTTLVDVYRELVRCYSSDRPTSQRPDSHYGRARSSATSRGAATGKGSTSPRSRSPKAST